MLSHQPTHLLAHCLTVLRSVIVLSAPSISPSVKVGIQITLFSSHSLRLLFSFNRQYEEPYKCLPLDGRYPFFQGTYLISFGFLLTISLLILVRGVGSLHGSRQLYHNQLKPSQKNKHELKQYRGKIFPMHYRLRCPIGFLNVQKYSKSKRLVLTQGIPKSETFALFVKIMTQILCQKSFTTFSENKYAQNHGQG